jgi:hypothetical protein
MLHIILRLSSHFSQPSGSQMPAIGALRFTRAHTFCVSRALGREATATAARSWPRPLAWGDGGRDRGRALWEEHLTVPSVTPKPS